MFCYYCGKEINDDSEFCPFCGNQTDANSNNQQFRGADYDGYYEEREEYYEELPRRPRREESSGKNVMLLVCITVLAVVICILIAIIAINAGTDNNEPEPTMYVTEVPVLTAEPTEEPEEYVYYVRRTPYDDRTQLGSYETFVEAKAVADANKMEGYKVYDENGTLLYTPVSQEAQSTPPPTQKVTPTQQATGRANYRVRKSAYDADSQIGAYEFFENAKRMADANKYGGYEVYDIQGNLVYVP